MAPPQLDFYFPAPSIEAARQTLTACIQRGAGPALVIGPAGTGKTLLCAKLASQFRSTAEVVLLSNTQLCNRRALLQSILFELDLPYRDMDEGEVRLALIGYITASNHLPHGLVLLVDEAHSLTFKLLEEVRMLSNLVRDGQARVHVVLAGNSILEERFTSPKLEAFNQRVAARAYLRPFNREETLGYIQSQVALAGGNALDLFAPDACPAIYEATGGVPRLINQLCDHALIMAAAGGSFCLEAATIEAAWADLQKLPPPAQQLNPLPSAAPADTVEFGSLVDDDCLSRDAHQGWRHDPHASRLPAALDARETDAPADDLSETYDDLPALDAEQQLDEIARNLQRVGSDMDFGQPDPTDHDSDPLPFDWNAAPRIPSCEDWPLAYDPFTEPFAEEETVLVNRYSLAEQPEPAHRTGGQPWEPETSRAGEGPGAQTAVQVVDDDRCPADIPEQMASEAEQQPLAAAAVPIPDPTHTQTCSRTGRQSQFQRLFANLRKPPHPTGHQGP